MGFKTFLEKFVTADNFKPEFADNKDYFEMFVNPTSSEIRGTDRGIILPNGDLYIIKAFNTDSDDVIHEDFITFLINQKVLKNRTHVKNNVMNRGLKDYLAVFFSDNRWFIGESYNKTAQLYEVARDFMGKAEKKNPRLQFVPAQED